MASGWTNKGKYKNLGIWLRNEAAPTNFYAALITDAVVPTADTNTFTELTEIAAGNGYTAGGNSVARSAAGFDVWTEDDTNDRAYIQLVDEVWNASGGSVPASGDGASYMILTDDNAIQANREIYFFWDLAAPRTVSDTQSLTIQDAEARIS